MTQAEAKLEFEMTVSEDGVLQLPPELLEQFGLSSGGTAWGTLEDGKLVLITRIQRARRAQQRVREYMQQHGLEWPTNTGAERIRQMRDEDAAIEAQRGR